MIRYAIGVCAFLAFVVVLYGAYALYAYRTSVQETESGIESPEMHFVPTYPPETTIDTSAAQQ